MTTLLAMLPIYLFGNLHCLGMCGPLVMMIGRHRYRYFYFFGRTLALALAGMIAGELGAVVNVFLNSYHIAALTSFLFGGVIFVLGACTVTGYPIPGYQALAKRLEPLNRSLTRFILSDRPWQTFLFGFFTPALPCGQTLIILSASALSGDALIGMLNGVFFALLTSPSLFLAMQTHTLIHRMKNYYNILMGGCAMLVGIFSLLPWPSGTPSHFSLGAKPSVFCRVSSCDLLRNSSYLK